VTLPSFEPDTFRMQVRRVTPCTLTYVHKRVVSSLHHHEDGGSWLLWKNSIIYPSQKAWIFISTAASLSDLTSMTVAYCEVFSATYNLRPGGNSNWRSLYYETGTLVLHMKDFLINSQNVPHFFKMNSNSCVTLEVLKDSSVLRYSGTRSHAT